MKKLTIHEMAERYKIMDCLGAIILRMKGYNIQNWDREIVIGEDTYNVEIRKVIK